MILFAGMSQGVYVLGGKCPRGKCLGGKCTGVCVLGVSVPGVYVRGGYVLEPFIIDWRCFAVPLYLIHSIPKNRNRRYTNKANFDIISHVTMAFSSPAELTRTKASYKI